MRLNAADRVGKAEGVGGNHLAGRAVEYVQITIAIRVQQRLAQLAVDRQINQHHFIDAVPIIEIVRIPLEEPARLAGIQIAREDAAGLFVVAGTLLRVPRAGIGRAVHDEVLLSIVGDESPNRAAANLPMVGRPGGDTRVFAFVLIVKWFELWSDQTIGVGAGALGAPGDLAGIGIERRQPAAHAKFTAAVADEDFVVDDQRGHRHRLAFVDVAEFGLPNFLPRVRVNGNCPIVERVVENPAVGIGRAAIDQIATGDTLGGSRRTWVVLPFQWCAGFGQIERVQVIRKRRDEIERVVHDERRALVPADYAGGEGPGEFKLIDVAGIYFGQATETLIGVILGRHCPLPIISVS